MCAVCCCCCWLLFTLFDQNRKGCNMINMRILDRIKLLHSDRPSDNMKLDSALCTLYRERFGQQIAEGERSILQAWLTALELCGDFQLQRIAMSTLASKEYVMQFWDIFSKACFGHLPKTEEAFIALVKINNAEHMREALNSFNAEKSPSFVYSIHCLAAQWNGVALKSPKDVHGFWLDLNCGSRRLSLEVNEIPSELNEWSFDNMLNIEGSHVTKYQKSSFRSPNQISYTELIIESEEGVLLLLLNIASPIDWCRVDDFLHYITYRKPKHAGDGTCSSGGSNSVEKQEPNMQSDWSTISPTNLMPRHMIRTLAHPNLDFKDTLAVAGKVPLRKKVPGVIKTRVNQTSKTHIINCERQRSGMRIKKTSGCTAVTYNDANNNEKCVKTCEDINMHTDDNKPSESLKEGISTYQDDVKMENEGNSYEMFGIAHDVAKGNIQPSKTVPEETALSQDSTTHNQQETEVVIKSAHGIDFVNGQLLQPVPISAENHPLSMPSLSPVRPVDGTDPKLDLNPCILLSVS